MRHTSIATHVLRVLLPCLVLIAAVLSTSPSLAATTSSTLGTVIGTVIDQKNALPIAGAKVTLMSSGETRGSATTDSFGNFTIDNIASGSYTVSIRAKGYAPSVIQNLVVGAGATVTVNAAMIAAVNTSNVRTLGTVTVTAGALATATTITQTVNVQNIANTGQVRFAQALSTLPAINLTTSSSPGDDVSINIRGFGSSETATLLDGRPVGPLGVLAPDTYDFANSPLTGLEGVDVTYGSGALGLYGSDTIAGAVNMHLLNPSTTPQYIFQQQVGNNGILSSALDLTGTEGKFGYVAAGGVSGIHGVLNGDIAQTARPELLAPGAVNPPFDCSNSSGNDVSQCNLAATTYDVGQETKLNDLLGRMRYSFSGATSLTVSAYATNWWSNSTGNGDNDYLPFATRLGQINQTPPIVPGVGAPGGCLTSAGKPGYLVVTKPVEWNNEGQPTTAPVPVPTLPPGMACFTANQWATSSYGPDGGGAGRQRGVAMQDYDSRFTTMIGKNNNVVLDYYVNNYQYNKDSSLSAGLAADGLKLGTPVFGDQYLTHGYLLSDDIVGLNNDLGIGYAILNQNQFGQQLVAVSTNPVTGQPNFEFQPAFTPAIFREDSFFLRDTHEFGERWSGFLNAWVKRSNVTDKTTFDPRVSGQYRPDSNDVLRLTYGHSDGPPAPQLESTGALFQPSPGSSLTNVSCIPGSNTLPTGGGNPNLKSETADDYELGFGHRFEQDSNIQVNAYVTTVADELFGATQPLLAYGLSHVTFGPTTLPLYLTKLIDQGCLPPGTTDLTATYPFLGVATTYNVANELARGIDINGRYRMEPWAYIDYGWSAESSQQFNIPDSILMNNVTIFNGGQQTGLPVHQATLSLDLQPDGFEFRIDNYYTSINNSLDRTSYWYSNAFLSHPFDNGKLIATIGGYNIFNQAVQTYGLIGEGVPVVTNQFAPPAPFTGLGQNLAGIASNERFGIQPAQLSLTLTAKM